MFDKLKFVASTFVLHRVFRLFSLVDTSPLGRAPGPPCFFVFIFFNVFWQFFIFNDFVQNNTVN